MKNNKLIVGVAIALLMALLAIPALAAPANTYTVEDLRNEVAGEGSLQKLWVTYTENMVLEDGTSEIVVMPGEAVYCEDPTPVNGFVLVYIYRMGYSTSGEMVYYLYASGYVRAGGLSETQPPPPAEPHTPSSSNFAPNLKDVRGGSSNT